MQRDNNQELFDYIHNELGVTALSSQMGDIECIVLGKEEYIRQQNEIMNHLPSQEDKPLVVEGGSGRNIGDMHDEIIAILKMCEHTAHRNVGDGCNHEQYILPTEYNLIAGKLLAYRNTPPSKAPVEVGGYSVEQIALFIDVEDALSDLTDLADGYNDTWRDFKTFINSLNK